MKLLLDENLPHQLRHELPGHEAYTAAYMSWSGVENGELLRLAAEAGFDALITNDRGLQYQQNPDDLPLAIVVLIAGANTIEALRPLCSELLQKLASLQPCTLIKVSEP